MFHFTRRKKIILTAMLSTALFLAFSSFSPVAHSQTGNNLIPPFTINTNGNGWNGYLAFDLELGSGFMGTGGTGNYLVVMDTNGSVRALRQSNSSYAGSSYNISPYTLMFQGEPQVSGANTAPTFATHFWNLSTGKTVDFPHVISHHDIQYDPINNTFLTLQDYVRQIGDRAILFDRIVQVDSNGNVLWTWDTYDHIPLSEASPFGEESIVDGHIVEDFTHTNTLDWHYNDSIIFLNARNTNTFYKINQTTGNIIWACGEFGNFTLIGENHQPVSSLWYHCHDVKEVAPNVFTLFDNDYCNNTNPNNCHSRMVELIVNEASKTAYEVWSWGAPTKYWNAYACGTVKLPNGDYIGDFGDPSHQFANNQPWNFEDTGAVLVEVNPSGQVVKTFTFPVGCYIYRVAAITNPTSITFPTPIQVVTPTPTETHSSTPTQSHTANPTQTHTFTPTPTNIVTPTPTHTVTPTPSVLPSSTPNISKDSQSTIITGALVAVVVVVILVAVLYFMKKRTSKPLL
jgi:hypothetical protein